MSLEASGSGVERALTDLVAQLEITNERLKGLSENLLSVDQRLAGSIHRQQEFERFIVTRLAAPTSFPPLFPKEWVKSQEDIVTEILTGTDPLLLWYKSIPREN